MSLGQVAVLAAEDQRGHSQQPDRRPASIEDVKAWLGAGRTMTVIDDD